jgi:hypothetical protein
VEVDDMGILEIVVDAVAAAEGDRHGRHRRNVRHPPAVQPRISDRLPCLRSLPYRRKGRHDAFDACQNRIREVTAVSGESAKTPSIPMQKNSRNSCVGCSP